MVLVGDLMKKIKFLIIIALIFLTTSCSIDNKSYSDEKLKIHGLQNIRVADASIMPEITSGNLNAPTLMIGERASDFILNS